MRMNIESAPRKQITVYARVHDKGVWDYCRNITDEKENTALLSREHTGEHTDLRAIAVTAT